MKMAPVFSITGQLIAHVDIEKFPRINSVTQGRGLAFDNAPREPVDYQGFDPTQTVEVYNVFLREIAFRDTQRHSQLVSHLVAPSPVPDWFYDLNGVVRFDPNAWRP